MKIGDDAAILADLMIENATDTPVTLDWLQFYFAVIGQSWDDRSNLCSFDTNGCMTADSWNFPRLFFGDAETGQWLLGPIFPSVFHQPGNWHVMYLQDQKVNLQTDIQALLDFKIYPDSQGMQILAHSKRRFVVDSDIRQTTSGDMTKKEYLVWLLNFAVEPKVQIFYNNLQPQQGVWWKVKIEH
ncbi:hypothetical protein IT408_03650 [Candidatus Uhrbacteria bacterium]|nr:hypothetical protein [Candidatus Uhrbacteria bacterium]